MTAAGRKPQFRAAQIDRLGVITASDHQRPSTQSSMYIKLRVCFPSQQRSAARSQRRRSQGIQRSRSGDVTIDQIVDIVERIAGTELELRYDPHAPQGVSGGKNDNTMIMDLYDWEPATSLNDGLRGTYQWIAEELRGDPAESTSQSVSDRVSG